MKRMMHALIAAALMVGAMTAAAEKPVVAVTEFSNQSGAGWWRGGVGYELADMLANELSATRAFRVVEYTTECANRWFEFVGPDRPIAVRLWIDTATGLPAKRRVDLAEAAWFEESYGLFELDVELPPALRAPAPAPEPEPEPELEPEPAPAAGRRWF